MKLVKTSLRNINANDAFYGDGEADDYQPLRSGFGNDELYAVAA